MSSIVLLAGEFVLFFLVLPLLIVYRLLPDLPIPYLLLAALLAFLVLRREPGFRAADLLSFRHAAGYLPRLLLRDGILLVLLGVAVRIFAPELLFSFVKRSPGFWALVMVAYPLVSVFPQELLYRAFFFHRYQPIFGTGWALLAASGLAFGFVHIIFGNWLSVALCIAGGLLFALTYQQTGSLLLACLDHALYGNFIFTIGLGRFFYHGTRL